MVLYAVEIDLDFLYSLVYIHREVLLVLVLVLVVLYSLQDLVIAILEGSVEDSVWG